MHIRKATIQDVSRFMPTVEDINEFKANNPNRDLMDVLTSHLTESSVVLMDGPNVLAYGGNQGDCVWFLTDHRSLFLTGRQRHEFFEHIVAYRDLMLGQYPVIWNFVWSGNKSHIKLLKRIGAKFHNEWATSPVTGERFQLFTISKEDVCANQ